MAITQDQFAWWKNELPTWQPISWRKRRWQHQIPQMHLDIWDQILLWNFFME
jgi:hypothetical protein